MEEKEYRFWLIDKKGEMGKVNFGSIDLARRLWDVVEQWSKEQEE